jgi:hypothetical protein
LAQSFAFQSFLTYSYFFRHQLFSNPTESDLVRYFQGGAIAAYEKTAMIKLHYEIADALDECLEMLDHAGEPHAPVKPRTSLLREKIKTLQELEGETGRRFSLPADMKHGLTESQHDSSACSETSVSSVRSTL